MRDILIAKTEGWLAHDGDQILAIMSLKPGWVEQLYVATDRQGEGIGLRLAGPGQGAQRRRAAAVDVPGQRPRALLHERNDFVVAELTDGAGNSEREPDVRFVWREGG